MADDQATERGRNDAGNGVILETLGERAAELFGVLRMLQNERALDVCGAVASAGKFKMSRADGAYLFEQLQKLRLVASHSIRRVRRPTHKQRVAEPKAKAKSVNGGGAVSSE